MCVSRSREWPNPTYYFSSLVCLSCLMKSQYTSSSIKPGATRVLTTRFYFLRNEPQYTLRCGYAQHSLYHAPLRYSTQPPFGHFWSPLLGPISWSTHTRQPPPHSARRACRRTQPCTNAIHSQPGAPGGRDFGPYLLHSEAGFEFCSNTETQYRPINTVY